MGLTESSPSSASGYTIFGITRIYRSVRNSAAELTRSPSAPARILSSAPSPECGSANSNGVSSSLAVKSPLSQVGNDETARVAVLADGSCAFFRVRRKSQPSKQDSAAQKRLSHLPMPSPSEKGSVLTPFLEVAGVSFLPVRLFEFTNTVGIKKACGLEKLCA
jgi:hypothetical protein